VPLRADAACFVTLRLDGNLRGCTGTALARRPLIEDVAGNAFTSAFADPRFAPLSAAEFSRLETEISVLSAPEPLGFEDEAALLALLEPGEDGLLLEADDAQALFLPQVWRTLPLAADFLAHLKAKAGLPADPLTPAVRAARFRVVEIVE
jgi:AmmeMemoRadiSam system protein A